AQLETVRKLLDAGATGHLVNEALVTTIAAPETPEREALVGEFVYHGADVNVGRGRCFVQVAEKGDIAILSLLLAGTPSPESLSQGILPACKLKDHEVRFTILDLLVTAGAQGQSVDEGLATLVDDVPVDLPLVALLLEKGSANVNVGDGLLLEKAAAHGNFDLMCILLQYNPSLTSLKRAFLRAVTYSEPEIQYKICHSLLVAGVNGEPLDNALITVQRVDEVPPQGHAP
ncbi:hypothetical protein KEM55_001093, partial [Ascosphaera atra]